MHIKTDNNNVKIEDLDITVRTKVILKVLGVKTIGELHLMHILETIPKIGTVVGYVPKARIEYTYSKKVHEEVKDILHIYCRVDKESIQ